LKVPEKQVDDLHHLGGVPPTVPVEDVVEPLPAEHVADPDAELVASGPLFLVPEAEGYLSAPLDLVGDGSKLFQGLRLFRNEVLVVVDDDLLDLDRNAVDGPSVGGPLTRPVEDRPSVVLVGVFQRPQSPTSASTPPKPGPAP
jgi:hypothetical protein